MTELCYLLQMRKFFLKNASLLHCSNFLFSSKALPLGLFCILYSKTKSEKDQRKNERVLLFAANAEILLKKNAAFLQHSCSKKIFGSKTPPVCFSTPNCTTSPNLVNIEQEIAKLCYLLQIHYIPKLLLRQCSISAATSGFFAIHLF